MTARIQFDVVSNGSSARRDLAQTRGELDKFGRSTTGAGTAAGKSQGKVSRFGSVLGGLGKIGGVFAAGFVATKVLKFGADAIQAASDTQQAFGAIDSVFGQNAKVVKDWANGAAESVGLARSEYGNLAVVLGSMLKNTGITDYAGQTKRLIRLGSDLAATYGGTTKDAVESLGALLRGETDPIEKYGVTIKQSGVNALLAANGQSKLTGKALIAAQQQARLKLLMQQTNKAQGQFRRETDTLAGSQQRLNAKWTNAKDTLGRKLLPVGQKIVGFLSNTISGTNKTSEVFRKLAKIYMSYLNPVLAALKRGLAIIVKAFKDSSGKGDSFGSVMKSIGRFAAKLAPILGRLLGKEIVFVAKAIAGAIRGINGFINAIKTVIGWAKSGADAVGRLADKLSSIKLPGGGILSKIGGIFRSDPASGLVRSAGGSRASTVRFSPTLNVLPTIRVSIGRRELRSVVVDVVRSELRDQTRRDDGGGERE